ncbi:hypothetical protein D9756_010953 [Leucocoprinus leucothites]|uniref:SWIM-type domain-containing protein n=1 Tax=Leucocoprinus leucothites TaxID=201217 RepID=A0A8H5CV04_9AGAR|nr:hypothetical protein D9756_010953 [Leucoagaricus leucothites]
MLPASDGRIISPQKKQRIQTSLNTIGSSLSQIHPTRKRTNNNQSPPSSEELTTLVQQDATFSGGDSGMLDIPDSVMDNISVEVENTAVLSSPDYYQQFAEGVTTQAIPFLQLSEDLYVATGWDNKVGRQTKYWYHIQIDHGQETPIPVCNCPDFKNYEKCIHQQYLQNEDITQAIETFGYMVPIV